MTAKLLTHAEIVFPVGHLVHTMQSSSGLGSSPLDQLHFLGKARKTCTDLKVIVAFKCSTKVHLLKLCIGGPIIVLGTNTWHYPNHTNPGVAT